MRDYKIIKYETFLRIFSIIITATINKKNFNIDNDNYF